MWTVKPAAMPVQFLRGRTGAATIVGSSQPPPRNYERSYRRFVNFPTKSQTSESETVGGLGQKILLRTGDSEPDKPIPKEISGSDVLWAIQRATAQRKRTNAGKKKMIRGVELSSSAGESTGDNGDDYSNVRPLRINSDWGHKLVEFEKLLKEFQNTEL
ncbi:hypothetical protein CARUB_v10025599mg [Capsella rubella]|uniref:Uncharacterized protein n=1 Tax=Capsella rubella TaxID=81985 RepID=R0HZ10_9BRAS|nr:uncharacterized protein LOC17888974 [Capsella rubella]EOA29318.1 hypothetical protein CARUB_v10025599mg [Capsella rubella]